VDRVKVHFSTVISKSQKFLTLIGAIMINLIFYLHEVMVLFFKKFVVPPHKEQKILSV